MPGFPLPPLRGSGCYYIYVRFFAFAPLLTLILAGTACYHGSKPSAIDRRAYDFKVQDSDRTVTLDQFKGKVVVLNFWASWCPPCVEETPSLVELQKLVGPNVTILAVSEDSDDSAYKQFIRDHQVDILTVRDGKKTNELYGTFRYPETFVIDRSGKIVRKFIGATDWTNPEIVDYLKKL